jgi:hypothetical protein
MYRVIKLSQDETLKSRLETLLWDNFDCIKKSLILIPKLSINTFMKDEVKESLRGSFEAVQRVINVKDIMLKLEKKSSKQLQ